MYPASIVIDLKLLLLSLNRNKTTEESFKNHAFYWCYENSNILIDCIKTKFESESAVVRQVWSRRQHS